MILNLKNIQIHNINNNFMHHPLCDEERKLTNLWRAVIREAIIDASNKSYKRRMQSHKIKARRWLKKESNDFKLVCQMANLNPVDVSNQFKKIMQN